MLTVKEIMTLSPLTIEPGQPIKEARKKMASIACEHLPVLSGGQLVGVVSDRDILYVYGRGFENSTEVLVGDVMIAEVFKVDSDAPIEEAVKLMLEKNIGSLLVTEYGKLIGILTQTDIMKLFLKDRNQQLGSKNIAA